jgi:hypothetical protein
LLLLVQAVYDISDEDEDSEDFSDSDEDGDTKLGRCELLCPKGAVQARHFFCSGQLQRISGRSVRGAAGLLRKAPAFVGPLASGAVGRLPCSNQNSSDGVGSSSSSNGSDLGRTAFAPNFAGEHARLLLLVQI